MAGAAIDHSACDVQVPWGSRDYVFQDQEIQRAGRKGLHPRVDILAVKGVQVKVFGLAGCPCCNIRLAGFGLDVLKRRDVRRLLYTV